MPGSLLDEVELFKSREVEALVTNAYDPVQRAVEQIPADQVARDDPLDLASQVAAPHLIQMVTLRETERRLTTSESQHLIAPGSHHPAGLPVDWVPGTTVVLQVPFDGDARLFTCSAPVSETVVAEVSEERGLLSIGLALFGAASAEKVSGAFESTLNVVRTALTQLAPEVERINSRLAAIALELIVTRKARLETAQDTAKLMNIKLERSDITRRVVIPLERRKPKFESPDERYLDDDEYKHILHLLMDGAIAMERSPSAFARMEEEHIRDVLLVLLNSHYEGRAGGETFNNKGKTDILIPFEDGVPFIAECKNWRGAQEVSNAIDQLFGYLTWRNTKAALLIFNRGVDPTTVLHRSTEAVRTHPTYLRDAQSLDARIKRQSAGSFVLAREQQEITLTLLVFDVTRTP